MDVKPEMYPGYTDEAHPECFNKEAMPQQPSVKKPGQLPESMIKQYFEKGYVMVEDFFKPEELEPCKRDIEKLVDEVAQKLYTAEIDINKDLDICPVPYGGMVLFNNVIPHRRYLIY
ncbi:hypothetical protein AM593_10405, partial [Mytilus galloprovincialis]